MNTRTLLTAMIVLGILLTGAKSGAQVTDASHKLIVNNFQSDPGKLDTRIIITDVDGNGLNVKISIHLDDGRMVYERYEGIIPFGKIYFNPTQYVNAYQHGLNQKPKFRGTVRIESDGGNIIGQYWATAKDGGKGIGIYDAAPAASTYGAEKLICQHFVSDKNVESALILSNSEDMRPVSVNIKFIADEGGLISTETLSIPPSGRINVDVFKATKGLKLSGTAYIAVIGPGAVTGEYSHSAMNGKIQASIPMISVTRIR